MSGERHTVKHTKDELRVRSCREEDAILIQLAITACNVRTRMHMEQRRHLVLTDKVERILPKGRKSKEGFELKREMYSKPLRTKEGVVCETQRGAKLESEPLWGAITWR